MPDPKLGEKLVLVVEGEAGEDLIERLRQSAELDKYEVPKALRTLPNFSMTPSGKINRPETLKGLI